jgi:hypothetical protein
MVLLAPSGSSAFMDLPRPPVKAGRRANHRELLLQLGTACQLQLFEILDGGEMLIDEHGVRQLT